MNVRKLKKKDSEFMLEWMHDKNVVEFLQNDFNSKTIEDCLNFIDNSEKDTKNIHLAITDDKDEYMGTVSLKNIQNNSCEFAIAMRSKAMGKGYALEGMRAIIKKGFDELGVKQIYWCVNPDNKRAVHFYEKNGFSQISKTEIINMDGYTQEQIAKYIWYRIEK